MADELEQEQAPPAARPPLGPGESDGKPNIGVPETTRGPLGPGESGRAKPNTALPVRRPLGPGESDGTNPEDGMFEFIAPPPPGPGAPQRGPRSITKVKKRQPPAAAPQ